MTRTEEKLLTADNLLRLYSGGARGELIRGALCRTTPKGLTHGEIVMNLGGALRNFVRPRRLGRLVGSDSGMMLERDPDTVREPDIAFISAQKLPLNVRLSGCFEGAPDLAVEIVSPSDGPREVYHKARMWISFGVPLVWVVDPENRAVEVHRPNQPLLSLTENEILDGGEVLPGFSYPVRDVFDL
ncbi:MAG: Uma2 family endonuclease [Caldilineaceae bacterium SB0661_bin_32]|uniref:Uma2 family endonuclease n=1 Tax=Caldilineaceae bacterium SB0661_bin_32 TaxID=2605255 RepID=A0A6B1D5K5_9CHLR|nr:Uma2 family endonuclease [Caldilineaceae bacterium SB0661_bin_32]